MAGRIKKVGNWPGGRSVTNTTRFAANITRKFNEAILINAQILRGEMINGIRKNKFGLEPLSEITTTIKGSNVPLADRGDLTNSIHTKLLAPGAAFVGIARGTKKRGRDMINVARIMHEGSFKGVDLSTPKGRRSFRAMAWKIRKKKKKFKLGSERGRKPGFIFTPPRPWIPQSAAAAAPFFRPTNVWAAKKVWESQAKGV